MRGSFSNKFDRGDRVGLETRLIALFVGAAGLIVAIFLGVEAGGANYKPLVSLVVVVIGVWLVFFAGRFFWVITVASASLVGTFPVLGGSFTPFNILMAIGVFKFFVEDVALRRTRLQTGNRFDFWLIAGFMAILTLHGLHDRFGMRFLGSTVWGGRNYVNVYVGFIAFCVIQSIPINLKLWVKLPYIILGVITFDLTIALLTTIFPSLIYKIYPFYSGVSRTGIEEIVTGDDSEAIRLGSVGNFGVVLITLVFASRSLLRLFHPSNIRRIGVVAIGAAAVLLSSFRTAVFNALAVTLVAGFRDLKFKVLLLLPIVAALLFGVSIINSDFVHLPKEMQRSLSFMPGKWDTDMAQDASGSNEWRRRIWTVWEQEFFPVHPLIGRGFGFQSEWAQPSVFRYDPDADRQIVEVGNIHNGFFAALDTFGIIGTLFFLLWNIRLLARTLSLPFRGSGSDATAVRFLALGLGASVICYWVGAQDVGSFLPQEFVLASVFLRLRENIASSPATETTSGPKPLGVVRKELATT